MRTKDEILNSIADPMRAGYKLETILLLHATMILEVIIDMRDIMRDELDHYQGVVQGDEPPEQHGD